MEKLEDRLVNRMDGKIGRQACEQDGWKNWKTGL
jgi:hypothetical protein